MVYVKVQDRRTVIERARRRCEYCRTPQSHSSTSLSMEHIVPRIKDGPTTLANLALSCQGCNNFKGTKTSGPDPISGQSAPLYNPREQTWYTHFAWSADTTLVLGLTPTGRATVELLRLNREGVVNLRAVLHSFALHPPAEPAPDEPPTAL